MNSHDSQLPNREASLLSRGAFFMWSNGGSAMIQTIDFDELIWNHIGVKLPMGGKVYSATQLQIEHAGVPAEKASKLYAMYISRTKEVVCFIRVKESDLDQLRSLQNMFFRSRL